MSLDPQGCHLFFEWPYGCTSWFNAHSSRPSFSRLNLLQRKNVFARSHDSKITCNIFHLHRNVQRKPCLEFVVQNLIIRSKQNLIQLDWISEVANDLKCSHKEELWNRILQSFSGHGKTDCTSSLKTGNFRLLSSN